MHLANLRPHPGCAGAFAGPSAPVGYGLVNLAGIAGFYATWAQLASFCGMFATADRSWACLFSVLRCAKALTTGAMAMPSLDAASAFAVLLKNPCPLAWASAFGMLPNRQSTIQSVGNLHTAISTCGSRQGPRTAGLLAMPMNISIRTTIEQCIHPHVQVMHITAPASSKGFEVGSRTPACWRLAASHRKRLRLRRS